MIDFNRLLNDASEVMKKKDFVKAEDFLKRALELKPDSAEVYYKMAVIAHQQNMLEKAVELFEKTAELDEKDFTVHNNLGVIFYTQKKYKQAEKHFRKAVKINPVYPDALAGLAKTLHKTIDIQGEKPFTDFGGQIIKQLAEIKNSSEKQSFDNVVKKLKDVFVDYPEICSKLISDVLPSSIKKEEERTGVNSGIKIAFFHKKGMDSFLGDIINELAKEYEIKKIAIEKNEDLKLIDKWMQWADISWFEWCDELVIYGSRLNIANQKKIVCRLHRYEVFTNYPKSVNWNNIDKLIVVADHLKKLLISQIPNIGKQTDIITINNGVNLENFEFSERKPGFNIAYVGYLHQRKNPVLLLQIISKLMKKDKRYKLFVAGKFQDGLIELYWNYQIEQMGLNENVFFEGWQPDISKWLKDKNYVLSTSIHESFGYGIAEAMARGIKPVIHNFVFSHEIWDNKYIFNTVDEAVEMIADENYDSKEYRDFIEDNYSLHKQIEKIIMALFDLLKNGQQFNYAEYWNNRLNNHFNIEGVGYIGLGEIYNNFLYRNRIDVLEAVITEAFTDIEDKSILELGPGIGVFTEFFYKRGVKKYDAIDISKKAVEQLSKKYQAFNFIHGDVSESFNYLCKYDLIFAADVLLHVTDEINFCNTINNISNSLKDEGICIILDPISQIGMQSESPHVIIRNKEYINNILIQNNLKMINMLPIAYFMNYPFDRKIIGANEHIVLEIFNEINMFFSSNEISSGDKKIFGELLLQKERLLLSKNKIGLSEKLMVIHKVNNKKSIDLKIEDVFKEDKLKVNNKCHEEEALVVITNSNLTDRIIKKIEMLDTPRGALTVDQLIKQMEEFIPYRKKDIDEYDFEQASIFLGRREKVTTQHEMIEFILTNGNNRKLVISNIWRDVTSNCFTIPFVYKQSKKINDLKRFLDEVVSLKVSFQNNIAGFIMDKELAKDVNKNSLAYIWERGIPASQFMPFSGYLKIAERYRFAAKFINKGDIILEAPCGFGYGAAYFSNRCKNVVAIDIAKDNIIFSKEAYRHNNITWLEGNVTKLPREDGTFDVYVSYEVIEHLDLDLINNYIHEAYRVVRKGGRFIISTPNAVTRKHVNNPFHVKEYTFVEFQNILSQYFKHIDFYSVVNFEVENGIHDKAICMIAVCRK